MRRRIPYRVCSCTPNGVITHIETRLLKDLVNQEFFPIRCAENKKSKFLYGMRMGDLCAETGHSWWALKVWQLTANQYEEKGSNGWKNALFDKRLVEVRDDISESECELLLREVPRDNQLAYSLDFTEF